MDGKPDKRNPIDVDKWPLVQPYALNEVAGCFYSYEKEIINMTDLIQSIYI